MLFVCPVRDGAGQSGSSPAVISVAGSSDFLLCYPWLRFILKVSSVQWQLVPNPPAGQQRSLACGLKAHSTKATCSDRATLCRARPLLLPLNAHCAKARHLGGAQNAGFFPTCLPGSWPLSPLAFWVRTCFVVPPLACLLTQAPLLLSPPCSPEPSTATLVPSAAPQHLRRVNQVGVMCVAPGTSSPGFSSWLDVLAQCPRVSLISSVKRGG